MHFHITTNNSGESILNNWNTHTVNNAVHCLMPAWHKGYDTEYPLLSLLSTKREGINKGKNYIKSGLAQKGDRQDQDGWYTQNGNIHHTILILSPIKLTTHALKYYCCRFVMLECHYFPLSKCAECMQCGWSTVCQNVKRVV